MIRTRVGYGGGRKADPSYRDMGDHTETVQVDYDPKRITYSQLLDIFWQSHDPMAGSWGRQYMNAVFYHDEYQKKLALAAKKRIEEKRGKAVKSSILPLRSFTLAEDYHQKYFLKQYFSLAREMTRIYADHRNLVDSTAAARLNGYVGRNGSSAQLAREIDRLGLSDVGKQTLTDMVH